MSCNNVDVLSASIALKSSSSWRCKDSFKYKKKYEDLAVVVHVLQNTQNLIISYCSTGDEK